MGVVSDPFYDNDKEYRLWKNATSTKSWLWLDYASNDIVYMQDVDPATKKLLVYYFPKGFSDSGVSAYNFQLFPCMA